MDRREGGFRPRGGGNFVAPVKVGDELDVKIEAVGEKGDGIAKKNGFVLFVPNTHEGDNVKICVTRVLKKVGFAEVIGQGSGDSGKSSVEESASETAESTEDEENKKKKKEDAEEEQYEDTEDF